MFDIKDFFTIVLIVSGICIAVVILLVIAIIYVMVKQEMEPESEYIETYKAADHD